jgi:hypothetical protein
MHPNYTSLENPPQEHWDWREYPIEGYLTLREIRGTRDVLAEYPEKVEPRLLHQLGLSGVHAVEASVLDTNCDYYLPAFTITLTPKATAWDVMFTIAWWFADYQVMDDMALASLSSDGDGKLCIGLYCDENIVLSDEQVVQLPWD